MSYHEEVLIGQIMRDYPIDEAISDGIISEVSAQLLLRRIDDGLTQAQLADSMGITQPTLSKYENGTENLTAKTIGEILCKLGLTAKLVCRPIGKQGDVAYDSVTTPPFPLSSDSPVFEMERLRAVNF